MLVYIYKFLYILLYIVLLACLLSNAVGLPGNWILLFVVVLIAVISHLTKVTLGYLILCFFLVLTGEVIESLLGTAVVAKRGGSKWGIIGSFLGGLAGVVVGAPLIPPVGAVLAGFTGAFVGAVGGEYYSLRKIEPAMRVGAWAFLGRIAAIMGKIVMGSVVFWIVVVRTWP